jgi:hypothetical protein
MFASRAIFTGIREDGLAPEESPLYRRLLSSSFDELPQPLRAMHDVRPGLSAEGRAGVERGKGLLARLVCGTFRLPPSAQDVPVRVRFEAAKGKERWHRDFAGNAFSSVQEEGQGTFARLLRERFGPFAFDFALVVDGGRLMLVPRRWSLFGIPLPKSLGPRGDACESAEGDRFNFQVEIALPLLGLLIRYRGWLVPSPLPQG